jgi:hypothetical protein
VGKSFSVACPKCEPNWTPQPAPDHWKNRRESG